MKDPRDKVEEGLLELYNNYDQTVDVVSCWHSFTEAILGGSTFYRFGKFKDPDGKEFTPDFAVGVQAKSGEKVGPGSFICDVKKVPNPTAKRETEDGTKTPEEIFAAAVEDVFKYGKLLEFSSDGGPPKALFSDHDVVLMTPSEVSDSVYSYLKQKVSKKPFDIGRPLALVEYFYSQANVREKYVFKWKQGEANSEISHPILRQEMVNKAQPISVYPKHFVPYKIRHVICNDEPPEIYLLVFLWLEVFIKFLSEDDFEIWKTSPTNRVVDIEVNPRAIVNKLREEYSAPIGVEQARKVLETLCRVKKAYRKDLVKETFVIHFSNLSARARVESDQEGVERRTEFREYGRIFAALLANKEIKEQKAARKARPRLRGGRARAAADHPVLPFD